MSTTITRKPGPGRAVLERVVKLDGIRVDIGDPGAVYDDPGGGSSIAVGTLLKIHEFGLGVPQRPIVRSTLASRSDELRRETKTAIHSIAHGADAGTALRGVGEWLSDALVDTLDRGAGPALAASTLEDEQTPRLDDEPLHYTGQILAFLREVRLTHE